MRSLEANLRLYLKELGASHLFELLQMLNADGKNDKFPFFCSFDNHNFTHVLNTNTTTNCAYRNKPTSHHVQNHLMKLHHQVLPKNRPIMTRN